MTYIRKSSETLQALQDFAGRMLTEREERQRNSLSTPEVIKEEPNNKDIRKQPTAEDILLMEEYRRGVYQGD